MQELWEVTRRAHSGARGWKKTLAEPHLAAKEPWELGTLLHPILLSLPESPKVRTHSQGAEMDSGQLCPPERTWWSQCAEECKQLPPPHSPVAAWGQPSTQSSTVQGLQTQDWVYEPQKHQHPGRHWRLSIEERRQLAGQGTREQQDPPCKDISQIVAELVSEGVDKDVLLPQPQRCFKSNKAF